MKMHSGFKIVMETIMGREYGHVPGHQYDDVEVGMGERGSDWEVVLVEADRQAEVAGIDAEYRVQAVSEITDMMHDLGLSTA